MNSRLRPAVRVLFVCVAVLIVAYPVAAGTGYVVKCSNCDLEASLKYGPGRRSQTVAVGYCCTCDKFVRAWYDRTAVETDEERQKLEEPIGYVFCPESGAKHALYACPDCGKPFIAIEPEAFEGDDKRAFCPKCAASRLSTSPEC